MKKIEVLIVVLFVIMGYLVYQLDLSLRQTRLLRINVSEISKKKESLQTQFQKAQGIIVSLKEDLEAKTEEVAKEQAKARNLEDQFLRAKEDLNKLTEELNLIKDKEKLTEDRLQAAIEQIADLKKLKQVSTLKKNLTELNGSLNQKNKELARLKKKLSRLEKTHSALSETNESLLEKIEELEQAKEEEIVQVSRILTKKELELDVKEKEVEGLRTEIPNLQSRLLDLEEQLSIAKANQEKAARLINEVAQLNAALEEKLSLFSQPQDEKAKAEELKRKVEVFVSPKEP